MSNFNKFNKLSLIVLPLTAGGVSAQTFDRQPNLVIIFCDDLGYGDTGCYGNPTIKTPNIDKLATEGVKFTQFYVGAAVSTPSRGALLTGRLPVRNGAYGKQTNVFFPDSKSGLGQDEITLARVLKDNGYVTSMVGKWHLGHLTPHLPTDHGFETYYGIPYSNDMGPVNFGIKTSYPPVPLMQDKEIIESGVDQTQLTRKYTERAVEFINRNSDKPFFLYFAHTFPHVPLYTNDRFEGTSKRGLYGDVVEEIDWSVGEIMRVLKSNGLDENTLVIFSSDNGPWLLMRENGGSAGSLREGKGTWWEGGFRVPAIFRMTGRIKPCVSTQLMATMDIFPTFLTIAGIAFPQNVTLDGVNQSDMLFEEKTSARDEVFYWWKDELVAVRKGAWKLYLKTIHDAYLRTQKIDKPEVPELYNIETDISERFNKSADNPDIVRQLTEVAGNHIKNMVMKTPACDLR